MLLRNLQRASFRGVSFLVPSDEMSEGRIMIDHRFPDSSVNYAEDNGKVPAQFTLSAILAEPGLPGKIRSLRRAMTAPGPGTLKHPWAGNIFAQVDNEFKIKRSDKNAGYVEIELKFIQTGPPQLPGLVSGVAAVVTSLASTTIAQIFADFVAAYGSPFGTDRTSPDGSGQGLVDVLSIPSLSVIATAIEDVAKIIVKLGSASPAPADIAAQPGRFAAEPHAFADAMSAALRAPLEQTPGFGPPSPVGIYSSNGANNGSNGGSNGGFSGAGGGFGASPSIGIRGSVDSSSYLSTYPSARRETVPTQVAQPIPDSVLIKVYGDLVTLGETLATEAADISLTTIDRINRQAALAILASTVQSAAFACLAETVSVATYRTADDVERAEYLLTNRYELLQGRNLTAIVRAALADIYVAASEVLRDAAVRLPRIVTVSASNTPASVLSYMLYEDQFSPNNVRTVENRSTILTALNPQQTPLILAGDVLALMRDA